MIKMKNPRCTRLRGGSRLHPGAVRSQEQIDDQRDLLPHDVRNGHHQHPVRLRRRHRRHHRQQPARMRSLLSPPPTCFPSPANSRWIRTPDVPSPSLYPHIHHIPVEPFFFFFFFFFFNNFQVYPPEPR